MDLLEAAAGVDDTFKVKVKGKWRWQCNQCDKNYSTKYSLMTHRVGHTGIKPFVCIECGKAFKQLSHLNTHQLRHAGLRPHCCTICGKRFVQGSHLKRHLNVHNPEGALYCDLCPRKFTYPSEVRAHKEKMHGPNRQKAKRAAKRNSDIDVKPVIPLIDLNKTGKENGGVVEKESQNVPADTSDNASPNQGDETEMKVPSGPHWQCNMCPLTFPSQTELGTHRTRVHEISDMNTPVKADDVDVDDSCATHIDGIRRWKCKKCAKTYATKYGLITHMVDHSGTKPFECKDCGKRFKQLSHLNTHQLRHAGLRPHSCSVCSKRFVQASHLKRHMHTHTTEGAFFCDFCPRKFTYPSELRLHKEKAHAPGKPNGKERNVRNHVDVVNSKVDSKSDGVSVILCPECGKSFNYQSQLDKHMKRHTNNRPHICKECGMQFMEIHHLNQHEFTHTGIKPHKCPVCSRGFTLEANMKRHLLIHSGVRNFECHLCRRRFAQKQTLRAHMIVHSDAKPHVCKFCGKSFRRNRNLLCHLRLHTDSKPYKCLSCGLRFNRKGNLKKHQKDKHDMDPNVDFVHFQALNLTDDDTLMNSLNDVRDLHDVVGGSINNDGIASTDDIKASNDTGDTKSSKVSKKSTSEDVKVRSHEEDDKERNEEQSKTHELDNIDSEMMKAQDREETLNEENDQKLETGIEKGLLFTGDVYDSTDNTNQSLVCDNLLLHDGNSINHDDFIFNRDPIDESSTMLNDDDLKWGADLGELVDTDIETSSHDASNEIQCDNIVNKPRGMVSKYFEKKSHISDLNSEDVPELDIRVSKRKGLHFVPRKLDQSNATPVVEDDKGEQ